MAESSIVEQFRSAVQRREDSLARRDFAVYCSAVYPGFQLPQHVRLLIEKLEQVESGKLKRVAISLPPRHGKSTTVSQLFPCWFLGRNPKRSIAIASYGDTLAQDLGRKVLRTLSDSAHAKIFPESRLAGEAATRLDLAAGGSFYSVSRNGSLTGRGCAILICDDLLKDEQEARSAAVRRQVIDWYSHVALSRLTPDGAVILVGTRWGRGDLFDHLLSEGDTRWEVINLPALAEADDPLGRREGEPLWASQFSRETLQEKREEIGPSAWTCLYQGQPALAEGVVFKLEWFRSYKEAPASFTKIIQSWDCAAKTGEENDFSVCTTWGVTATGYYLLSLWRSRAEFPALRRQVALQAEAWKPHQILIEDTSAGQSLAQELKAATLFPVKAVKVDRDKRLRAEAVTGWFEAGKVFFPETAPWLHDFMDEMASFPMGQHDDCVDSVTQALNHLRGRPDSSGFFRLIQAQLRAANLPIDPSLLDDDQKAEIDAKKAREWEENRCRFEAQYAKPEDISVDENGHGVYWNARLGEWINCLSGAIVPSEDADTEA